jgi:Cu/Ag efflux protein CusF
MKKRPCYLGVLIVFGLASSNALVAQDMHEHGAHEHHAMEVGVPAELDELPKVGAEVRRVNLRANTLSLRHEAIPNLDMPPMTMVFQVSDPGLLEGVAAGDRVWVTVDQIDGAYTVLSVEPQP